MDSLIIQTKPEPYCPDCGGRMKLRRPPAGHTWRPFWGCLAYPDCKGKRQINDHGKPVIDEINIPLRDEEVGLR